MPSQDDGLPILKVNYACGCRSNELRYKECASFILEVNQHRSLSTHHLITAQ